MQWKVGLASLLFGFGSWITITGFWAELPVLIERTPEGWTLPSKLALFIQAANLGPVLYYFARKYRVVTDVVANHVQLFIGAICCVLLICIWDLTVSISSKPTSIILFIGVFGLSLTDCTSSVTFLPFMARLKPEYLTPYLIGEGLSGFIPIIVAWIQGVDSTASDCEPKNSDSSESNGKVFNFTSTDLMPIMHSELRFSPSVFFSSLLVTLLISWAAFAYLVFSNEARKEYKDSKEPSNQQPELESLAKESNKSASETGSSENIMPNRTYLYLQGLIVFLCLLTFGLMPGIQSYSTLNYGNHVLHYVVIFGGLAYPAGCFIAMLKHTDSLNLINICTLVGTAISIFLFYCAVASPNVPFNSEANGVKLGGIISVLSWCIYIGILSYAKTVITVILSKAKGEDALFWVGMLTQFGALFGAAIVYVLVNYASAFHDDCDN